MLVFLLLSCFIKVLICSSINFEAVVCGALSNRTMWNVPASLCSIVPLKVCGPPALLIAQLAGEFKMRDLSLFADRQSKVPWACIPKHTAVNLLCNFVLMIYSGGVIEVCVTKLPAWKTKEKWSKLKERAEWCVTLKCHRISSRRLHSIQSRGRRGKILASLRREL